MPGRVASVTDSSSSSGNLILPALPDRYFPVIRLKPATSLESIKLVTVALGVAIVAFIWIIHHQQFSTARSEALEARAAEHLSLATAIAESLRHLTDRAEAMGAWFEQPFDTPSKLSPHLSRMLADDPVFSRVGIYSLAGTQLFSSHESMPAALPDSWLEQYRARAERFAFKPFLPSLAAEVGRSDTPSWRLPLLLPLSDAGQRQLRYIMLIEMDVGYLASLIQRIELGRTGLVHLLDSTGQERLRADSSGVVFGEHPLRLATGEASGRRIHTLEGAVYLSLYSQLPERALSIAISQQYEEILEPVRAVQVPQRWLSLAMSGVILCVVLWLIRMLGQQQRVLVALQQSEQSKQQLIASLQNEHERSRRAASTDHLSGLYNRREFLQLASAMLAEQRSTRRLLAILFMDMDRFKSINDTLGHKTGDQLLQAVAGRVQRLLEPGDLAARFGGDEFVVLLAGERSEQQIADWTATLVERISAPYSLESRELNTSPSIGVAICPRDAEDIDSLIRNADAAMYSAKQAGRGQFRFYDPSLNLTSIEEFQLEQAFGDGLRKHQFVLHYQPQVRLENMKVIGYEALVRWQHPEFGLIYPDRFIGIAERSGFIVPLGMEVLQLACRQLAHWRAQGSTVCMGINVSPLQLNQPGFSDKVLEMLDECGLEPGWIELEITETAIVDREGIALRQLAMLKAAGVSISLDDFGRGYAGFAHLQALPITKLKLDRSLIAPLSNSHDDSPIVSSTIILAKRMGLQVVAEGVETRGQVVSLKLAGCDIAQGYHFSRPVAAEDVPEFASGREVSALCI